ncbi:unnamed protein product [Paramecium primaurelia]|uniref:Uncharacterized protein n=1 Tax=Paramecium primaurelia TaxID=5886 RepID=A0A8S1KEA0_PARPR|nr:unnamed protein product [Paramecium primaurelia]
MKFIKHLILFIIFFAQAQEDWITVFNQFTGSYWDDSGWFFYKNKWWSIQPMRGYKVILKICNFMIGYINFFKIYTSTSLFIKNII